MANKGQIKCTFPECYEHFPNAIKLHKHKKYKHEEEYCHICYLNFDTLEEAIAHKSQMSGMDAYRKTPKQYKEEEDKGTLLNNRQKFGDDYGKLKFHMYHCKFCGMAYRTESARRAHTIQYHAIDQNIKCPGCDSTFPKAAGMIYHLEEGHCARISSVEFKGYLQHKGLINRLLEDPTLLLKISEKDVHSWYESAHDEDQTGGVSLIDNGDITWDEDDILEPAKPVTTGLPHPDQMTFPSLPPHLRKQCSAQTDFADAMSGLKVNEENKPSAWGANASNELFPSAKPTPVTNEWQVRQQAQEREDHKSNILMYQFWNPEHPDYDPKRFWCPIIEKHRCPLPTCDEYFQIDKDVQKHIQEAHAITEIRCPRCLKLFRAHHALVAHVESSQKCPMKYSARFGQALDEFSGGFLQFGVVGHPDLKEHDDGYQIDFHTYQSAAPPGWEERVHGTTIGTNLTKI